MSFAVQQSAVSSRLAAPLVARPRAASSGTRVSAASDRAAFPAVRRSVAFSSAASVSSAASRRRAAASPCRATHVGSLSARPGLRVGIVVARFNELVTRLLLDGALGQLSRVGVDVDADVDVAWVPGSFELPVVASAFARSGKYDAVIAIGVVVKGATSHYDAVVNATTAGLANASTSSGVPVIFGVLTCETMDQALDRAGGKVGNKGAEAAATAVEMAGLLEDLRAKNLAAKPWA